MVRNPLAGCLTIENRRFTIKKDERHLLDDLRGPGAVLDRRKTPRSTPAKRHGSGRIGQAHLAFGGLAVQAGKRKIVSYSAHSVAHRDVIRGWTRLLFTD